MGTICLTVVLLGGWFQMIPCVPAYEGLSFPTITLKGIMVTLCFERSLLMSWAIMGWELCKRMGGENRVGKILVPLWASLQPRESLGDRLAAIRWGSCNTGVRGWARDSWLQQFSSQILPQCDSFPFFSPTWSWEENIFLFLGTEKTTLQVCIWIFLLGFRLVDFLFSPKSKVPEAFSSGSVKEKKGSMTLIKDGKADFI